MEFQYAHFERKLPSAITFHDCVNFFLVVSGAVLGKGDKICKSNDELKLERGESSDLYVLMTCHSRDLWCACAHIFQKRQLGELFGAAALNKAYAVFINK